MKWIVIVIILFAVSMGFAEEMIEIPKSELEEYLARMEKDRETIQQLRKENLTLMQETIDLKNELAIVKTQNEKQIGIYMGGGVGYPLPSFEGIMLYKFNKWGVYVSGGYYGKGFSVNLGSMVKMR